MSDLSTSLKEIFNERISSPFYGSLIVSWLLWNWKIPYVTFFVDQDRLVDCTNKIDYIINHCNNWWHLTLFPLGSTALILLVMPYITNGASWVTEKFDTWRINKKNEVQGKRLLTVEEALQLRIEIQNQEGKYNTILSNKDAEILSLKKQLEITTKQPSDLPKAVIRDDFYKDDFLEFMKNEKLSSGIELIDSCIKRTKPLSDIPKEIIDYHAAYDLIKGDGMNYYHFTTKGEYFLKNYLKIKFKSK